MLLRWGNISVRSFSLLLSPSFMSVMFRFVQCSTLVLFSALACAQTAVSTNTDAAGSDSGGQLSADSVVPYPAAFFTQYRPITALDMVERVPGFSVDDGDGSRGFGGAAGNLLINGERPSTKQDSASDILQRIPASQVERLDLIRGQGGGLDLRGQSVAVNVILKSDGGTAFTWEAILEQDVDSGGPTPQGILSATQRIGATQLNVGLDIRRFFFGNPATEILSEPIPDSGSDELVPSERREEYERTKGREFSGTINTETRLDDTLIHFNSEVRYQTREFIERSDRTPIDTTGQPQDALTFDVDQDQDRDIFSIEVGADVEWPLAQNLTAKAITLYRFEDDERLTFLQRPRDGVQEIRSADTDNRDTETIGRMEFDFTGWDQHTVELDLEGAFNTLENELALSLDTGNGPEPIPVPGANTRVEEVRGDFRLGDSWTWDHWVMETALGAEVSNISQSGETGNDRDFFFWKPSWTLTYAADQSRQTRLRFLREVAQLDFNDFVSSTNFNDDDVDLGNADLSPDRTWVLELSHERRFGDLGAATVTVYHHWVQDVQDLLPVGGIFEVPGNIGNGRRWGADILTTIPLGWMGITGGRLDIDASFQDSSVTDPVTQEQRIFSDSRHFDVDINFRQDLQQQRWAWGWSMELVDEAPFFGLDEIDTFDRGVDLEAFIETTRWWGIKMRLTVENITNRQFTRDRRLFTGQRFLSPRRFTEFRDRRRGRSFVLSFSGSF